MDESPIFGELLRSHRTGAGWTQKDLADHAGLADRTVRALERGQRKPYRQNVQALADALHLSEQDTLLLQTAARRCGGDASIFVESVTPTYNLPVELTTLVNREREVADIMALLQRPSRRLLTLTGPGGVGKTRLALRVAGELRPTFADGVAFVDLGALQQATLVPSTMARALGLADAGSHSPQNTVIQYLRDKYLLLVLDNFEHVLSAAGSLSELLAECPDVKMLVTSREPLHLHGEGEFPVSPLALPPADSISEKVVIARYGAVQLFVDRAQTVRPDFELTDANARDVASICTRLDGVPLAIELAAGRTKLLPPAALLTRLDMRLPLLIGGAQDIPIRLRTMEDAIGWSYDLLDDAQRSLFRQLAVFEGGCTLEAAEAICARPGSRDLDVLEWIMALVDKNLIRQIEQPDGTPRLIMLDTIHEYGRARLAEDAESIVLVDRHARYYAALAEEANDQLAGKDRQLLLDRLDREHDNLRAALGHFEEVGSLDLALQLAGALYRFWYQRGHAAEGRPIFERLLSLTADVDNGRYRARVLNGAGVLATSAGMYDIAEERYTQALVLYQAIDDQVAAAATLNNLGAIAADRGAYARAHHFFEQSLALSHSGTGDATRQRAMTIGNLGEVLGHRGIYKRARKLQEESLLVSQSLGDTFDICTTLGNLGVVSIELDEHERAADELGRSRAMAAAHGYKRLMIQPLAGIGYLAALAGNAKDAIAECERAVTIARALGDLKLLADVLDKLGYAFGVQGAHDRARLVYLEAFSINEGIGSQSGIAACLDGLGAVEAREGQMSRAARLWGAATALRATLDAPRLHSQKATYAALSESARQHLGDMFAVLWDEGAAMTLEEARRYAVSDSTGNAAPG